MGLQVASAALGTLGGELSAKRLVLDALDLRRFNGSTERFGRITDFGVTARESARPTEPWCSLLSIRNSNSFVITRAMKSHKLGIVTDVF